MDFIDNSKPIYLQIADRLCDDIMAGKYHLDDRVPSVREYAGTLQVNANTVMRSYIHLAAQGIIINKRGIGFFTTSDAHIQISRLRQETFFNDEMTHFFARLKSMGITSEQLSDLYQKYLKSTQQ